MKYLYLLAFLMTFTSFSQINFEPGYIIKNNGERVEGYIRNAEWLYNPEKVQFKTNPGASAKEYFIEDLKSFSVTGYEIFVRYDVLIDQKATNNYPYPVERNPKMEQSRVLLRLVVDGESKLLQYKTPKSDLFFYQLQNETPKQLIYRTYQAKESYLGYNEQFKQQLKNEFECENFSDRDFMDLKYSRESLKTFFQEYLKCKDSNYDILGKKEVNVKIPGDFKFKISPKFETIEKGYTVELKAIGSASKYTKFKGNSLKTGTVYKDSDNSTSVKYTFSKNAKKRTFKYMAIIKYENTVMYEKEITLRPR